tara:strand:- start:3722 stop:3985 length:264 start_codon:yes stop_codon:yes gene_type:complete
MALPKRPTASTYRPNGLKAVAFGEVVITGEQDAELVPDAPVISSGSGVPTASRGKGSLYLRDDGASASEVLYVNTDGGTTWVVVSAT